MRGCALSEKGCRDDAFGLAACELGRHFIGGTRGSHRGEMRLRLLSAGGVKQIQKRSTCQPFCRLVQELRSCRICFNNLEGGCVDDKDGFRSGFEH